MAATRKPAKRAGKKRAGAKSSTTKKKRSRGPSAASSKKVARKKKRGRRGPLSTVRKAGEKTWAALKSTTTQVVEGVKGRFE